MHDERPQVTGTSHTLPFERLSPDKFEELCLWLLRRDGYEVRHRGLAGQDGGADLVADRGGERLAVQCKREQNFGPRKAADAVAKLVATQLDPPATQLLLAVSSSLSAEAEQNALAAARGLPLQIWASSELNERTKRHPDVLREFFQLDRPNSSPHSDALQDDLKLRGELIRERAAAKSAIGKRHEALDLYRESLSLFRQAGDRSGESLALIDIGSTLHDLRKPKEAIILYKESLRIQQTIGDQAEPCNILNNMGAAYCAQGNYEEALDKATEALEMARELADHDTEGSILNNIAVIHYECGDTEAALETLQASLSIHEITGDRAVGSTTLNNIALILTEAGRAEEAIDFCEEALATSRAIQDRWGEATILYNLARVLLDLKQPSKALGAFDDLIKLRDELMHPGLNVDIAAVEELRQELKKLEATPSG